MPFSKYFLITIDVEDWFQVENFRQFCQRVFERLPDTPVHYISIKPAKSRKKFWPEMQRANRMIKDLCDADPRLRYIDIVPAMQNSAGEVRGELFTRDGIHLNEKGYAVWRKVIRPAVKKLVSEGVISVAER